MGGGKNAERNALIVRMRTDGIGSREIARRLGVSAGVVFGVTHRAGITDPANCIKAGDALTEAQRQRISEACFAAWADPERAVARRARYRATCAANRLHAESSA